MTAPPAPPAAPARHALEPSAPASRPAQPDLASRYRAVRAQTEALCAPLETEDYVVSSMPDVSPTKWHLAHTSWFFETFVLAEHAPAAGLRYAPPDPRYAYLFNSYYVQAGERHCRAQRGLATRPTVGEVFAYRAHVDDAMARLLERVGGDPGHPAAGLVELGLHHEQQHQELLLMDIKHVFWTNPLRPAYRARGAADRAAAVAPLAWHPVHEGVYRIGHHGPGFAFDNEGPAHRVFLEPFRLASRLVTNAEYLAFVDDGGYERTPLWLSSGWAVAQERRWTAPLYWERTGRRVDRVHARRRRPARPRRARVPRQLLRGRRLRPLGGPPPADRGGVGARRGRRAGRRPVRRGRALPPRARGSRARRRGRRRAAARRRSPGSTATCGSGRGAPTSPTRGTRRQRARSGSTTASGCATSGCCAAPRAPRRARTRG
jgi:hypothetical protein